VGEDAERSLLYHSELNFGIEVEEDSQVRCETRLAQDSAREVVVFVLVELVPEASAHHASPWAVEIGDNRVHVVGVRLA
jgi:hypothetical protein